MEQIRAESHLSSVIDTLVDAVNRHDLEALVACFNDGYVNETPAHPQRGFRGNEQVHRNWTQIFAAVPDIRARVPRIAVNDDAMWSEWEMSGTRRDGTPFRMAGVVIFGMRDTKIASARFYLEPVDQDSGDVNAAVSRVVGSSTPGEDASRAT
ncbi:MAG: nuclear transport factor 2 family protein [Actinomycetota bacterium]|nr:nuclear transport factor 2 family protein [Actinomycetota bacterium]